MMKCPLCGQGTSRVLASTAGDAGVRRSRQCEACQGRFSTYEQVQRTVVMVVKRDGRREEFQREKLLRGLRNCASKRPLPVGAVEAIADDIEQRLTSADRGEVPSRVIGEMAITHLKQLDPIAYIRFASAYRQFVSLDDMLTDLAQLGPSPLPPAEQPRLFEDDFERLLSGRPNRDDGGPRAPTPIESARSASRA